MTGVRGWASWAAACQSCGVVTVERIDREPRHHAPCTAAEPGAASVPPTPGRPAVPAPRSGDALDCIDCSGRHAPPRCYSPTGPRPAEVSVIVCGPATRAGTGRTWVGQQARQARRSGPLQPRLAAELAEAGLTPAEAARGVELWNANMRGIAYGGGHHTALAILTGTLKHRSIPALPEPVADALAPLAAEGASVWLRRSWNVYGPHSAPEGPPRDLAGFDVNAMYLSAAAIDLGTGAPEDMSWPADSVLDLPGYVQVSSLENAPWSMGAHWVEGMWVPTPLAAYWRDRGAAFLVPRALVWPERRRWLDAHVDLMRRARTALIEDGSPAALAVLAVVKDVYARMFGGLLASTAHNRTNTLRPDWRALIVATGQARMLRGLDRVQLGGTVEVVGIHVDAAWFVLPSGWETPPGLVVSTQAGKFKPAGRTSWTSDLRRAWQDGAHEPLWAALDASTREDAHGRR